MEVLMDRSRPRVSRELVALLSMMLLVGIVLWFRVTKQQSPAASLAATHTTQTTVDAAAPPANPAPPTTAPTVVVSTTPTTQPWPKLAPNPLAMDEPDSSTHGGGVLIAESAPA